MTCPATGTFGVLSWAVIPIGVLLLTTSSAAIFGDLLLLLLVGGDGLQLLGIAAKLGLGPLCRLTGCGNFHALVQVDILLSEEVLLELQVAQTTEKERENCLITKVIHGFTLITLDF